MKKYDDSKKSEQNHKKQRVVVASVFHTKGRMIHFGSDSILFCVCLLRRSMKELSNIDVRVAYTVQCEFSNVKWQPPRKQTLNVSSYESAFCVPWIYFRLWLFNSNSAFTIKPSTSKSKIESQTSDLTSVLNLVLSTYVHNVSDHMWSEETSQLFFPLARTFQASCYFPHPVRASTVVAFLRVF